MDIKGYKGASDMEKLSEKIENSKLNFLTLRMKGNREASKKEKHRLIPYRLFRYERITEKRLSALRNNEIYMSDNKSFNDPFDCKGIYWNSSELHDYCKNKTPDYKYDKSETKVFFQCLIESAIKPLKIACFSEDNNNLPLWGNYADNRKGFCVEYNFKFLGVDSRFTEYLFPVFYAKDRFNCTFALEQVIDTVFDDMYHPVIDILFYKNIFKHSSWSYEREWRLIFWDEKENLVKMPTKPAAIYAGDQCEADDLNELKIIAQKLDCELFQLKLPEYNSPEFIFGEKLI